MKNGVKPAYPTQGVYKDSVICGGLTKREMFAMAAMQGFLSNPMTKQHLIIVTDTIAEHSVIMADKLLKQLES